MASEKQFVWRTTSGELIGGSPQRNRAVSACARRIRAAPIWPLFAAAGGRVGWRHSTRGVRLRPNICGYGAASGARPAPVTPVPGTLCDVHDFEVNPFYRSRASLIDVACFFIETYSNCPRGKFTRYNGFYN